jgi:hypothetical protein
MMHLQRQLFAGLNLDLLDLNSVAVSAPLVLFPGAIYPDMKVGLGPFGAVDLGDDVLDLLSAIPP